MPGKFTRSQIYFLLLYLINITPSSLWFLITVLLVSDCRPEVRTQRRHSKVTPIIKKQKVKKQRQNDKTWTLFAEQSCSHFNLEKSNQKQKGKC